MPAHLYFPWLCLSLLTLPTVLPAQTVAMPPAASLPTASWLSPISVNPSFAISAPFTASSAPTPEDSAARQVASAAYGRLPLSFEPNVGQVNRRAQFLCRGAGYSLFLTPTGAVLAMQRPLASSTRSLHKAACLPDARLPKTQPVKPQGVALYMTLLGANPQARGSGEAKQPGVVSYFLGKGKSKWHSGISTFGQVRYGNVYPGVDLLYYGNNRQLEYDLIVKPGADYHRAQLQFSGAQSVQLDKSGNLQLKLAGGETVWKHPVAYQWDSDGRKQGVASRYVLDSKTKTVRFVVGRYDHSRTLVLDPGLVYSTYLGGSGGDSGESIAVDANGNAYVTGNTGSTDFPITSGAFQTTSKGGDIFVTKLNATGTALLYSTYLGGSGGNLSGGIALDSAGNAYITGQTFSTDFPITSGAFQSIYKGSSNGSSQYPSNAFITKLSASGTALVYSTYLGGSGSTFQGDFGSGIAVDGTGNAYITGLTFSSNFPITSGAFQTTNKGVANKLENAFITKVNATGTALVYSTYLGGSGGDSGSGIAIDANGNAYVAGYAASSDFPVTTGAFQIINKSHGSAFITKLNAAGTALVYSTYLGGSGGDSGSGIAIDANGNAYVTGGTSSTDFPVTTGAFQTTNKGTANQASNAFIAKLNSAGTALLYSTYLGGSGSTFQGDSGSGIAIDANGGAFVIGLTSSTDFPITPGAFQATNKGNIADTVFITKLNATGTELLHSTFFGGHLSGGIGGSTSPRVTVNHSAAIALDSTSNVYITGSTRSADFPVIPGAFQTVYKGVTSQNRYPNAFVARPSLTAIPSRFDVNGDGNLDLLWTNQNTGDLAAWLQNGLTNIGAVTLASHVDHNWKITAVADLNGDGNADLLWRNQSTGDLVVWYLQGSTNTGYAYVSHNLPLAWQVVSSADFNGDGNPDLLLYNTQTGDVVVWYMQGSTVTSFAYLAHAVLSWQLVGSTDYYGAGHVDLLWRNPQTGDVVVWDVSGTPLQIVGYSLAYAVPLEWQIGALGDLDGNGVPDIVWRNTKTGDVAAWLFSDATHYTGASLASAVPLNWQLVGPR